MNISANEFECVIIMLLTYFRLHGPIQNNNNNDNENNNNNNEIG